MSKKALFITGASRGIGEATATLFGEQGYDVINLSRSPCRVKGVINFLVDLSEPSSLDVHADNIRELGQRYDQIVIIHNAATCGNDNAVELTAAEMTRVLQVNIVAPVAINGLLFPLMKPGSSIFYIGSTLSEKGIPNACSYVTSKHAIVGLMRTTCQDTVSRGIHTACICPGFTETEMLKENFGGSFEGAKGIADNNAFGRMVQPKEIAETLYFCAQSPVINGSVIHAHLGQIES